MLEARVTEATEVTAPANPPHRPVPSALEQWHDPNPRAGWLVAAFMVLLASVTRLWDLGFPQGKSFDEIYYSTEAQEMLRFGYEDNSGYMFIVHPPVGKWLIAFTSELWSGGSASTNSVGWRLAPAIAGIVSVLLITRIARRMFHSNFFGGVAGLCVSIGLLAMRRRDRGAAEVTEQRRYVEPPT